MLSAETDTFKITKEIRKPFFSMKTTHSHIYNEIYYLISGECSMFVNHNLYKLKAGDMVVIPAGEIHRTTYSANGKHERFAICFTKVDLKWVTEVLGDVFIDESIQVEVLSIPEKRRDYVEGIMTKLLYESEETDSISQGFTKILFQELILFIIRCQKYEESVVKEIDVDNRLIQEVATYIYNNYNKNVYLDDVAQRFNISRSYLSKKFKSTTGFGFKEYLVNVRIKEACKLLLQTNKTITEIAFLCGFNDSNYFGDAFRHFKGISPNKYRRNKETL